MRLKLKAQERDRRFYACAFVIRLQAAGKY
jgi:hypothetical protein